MSDTYFQKGFGLRSEVRSLLARSHHSDVVDRLKTPGFDATLNGRDSRQARRRGYGAADPIDATAAWGPA